MEDPVADYMDLERQLLTYRLTHELAGLPYAEDDPEEERIEGEFERVWARMTLEDRRRLRQTREMRSAPWAGAATRRRDECVLLDGPSPLRSGTPPRRWGEPTTCS